MGFVTRPGSFLPLHCPVNPPGPLSLVKATLVYRRAQWVLHLTMSGPCRRLTAIQGAIQCPGREGSKLFFARYANIRSAASRLPASFPCESLNLYNGLVSPC